VFLREWLPVGSPIPYGVESELDLRRAVLIFQIS
jgi:hypothetical protein